MRAELTVGLTGMSVFLQDPTYAGFSPDAQVSALLSFTGIGCLAILTLWSERWKANRIGPSRAVLAIDRYPQPEDDETPIHSSAI